MTASVLAQVVKLAARVLTDVDDYADLLATVGDRRLLLLGEATHGTHEFYDARAEITKRLVALSAHLGVHLLIRGGPDALFRQPIRQSSQHERRRPWPRWPSPDEPRTRPGSFSRGELAAV